jgi:hypothetical protein
MAHGVPPSGKSPVPETPLGDRKAAVVSSTLIQEASEKITLLDKVKAWFGNVKKNRDFSFYSANRTALINKVADEMKKPGNSALAGDATNAGNLLTELDSKQFGIFLEAMKDVGGEKLTEFKTALKGAIGEMFKQLKEKDPSLAEGKITNLAKNILSAEETFEGDVVTDQEILEAINFAKNQSCSDTALRAYAQNPSIAGKVAKVNDESIAAATVALLAAQPASMDARTSTDVGTPEASTDAGTSATPAASAAAAPAATAADIQKDAETIGRLTALGRIGILLDTAADRSEISIEIDNLTKMNSFLRKSARSVTEALVELHGKDRELFTRYCNLAARYPDAFIGSAGGMIFVHASDHADFSGLLGRLETQLRGTEDPDMHEALAKAYASALGFDDMKVMATFSRHKGTQIEFDRATALLDFTEAYPQFLTPEILEAVTMSNPLGLVSANLGHLRSLMVRFEDQRETQAALVELFADDPRKCHHLLTLLDDSHGVSAEVIKKLGKGTHEDYVSNAAQLREYNKDLSVEDMLKMSKGLGNKCSDLIKYAKAHSDVKITQELIESLIEYIKANPGAEVTEELINTKLPPKP